MEGTNNLLSHTTENDMSKSGNYHRYYIQWQQAIYRAPHAALRKLAAGDEQGFWRGLTRVKSAVWDHEKYGGWRQRGLPKGIGGDCQTLRSAQYDVRFTEIYGADDYDFGSLLPELVEQYLEDNATCAAQYEYARKKGWV